MRQSEELYARYVKPLEAKHAGVFVAVSSDGRMILGDSLVELADEAVHKLGTGSFVFKVGDRANHRP